MPTAKPQTTTATTINRRLVDSMWVIPGRIRGAAGLGRPAQIGCLQFVLVTIGALPESAEKHGHLRLKAIVGPVDMAIGSSECRLGPCACRCFPQKRKMSKPARHLHQFEDQLMKPRLHLLALRDEWSGEAVPGVPTNLAWEPPMPGRARHLETWAEYMAFASRVVGRFQGQFRLEHFDYVHPTRLQAGT